MATNTPRRAASIAPWLVLAALSPDATAGLIETRWVVTGDALSTPTIGNADDEVPDLIVGAGSGTLTFTLQARSLFAEGQGFAAVRGAIRAIGLGGDDQRGALDNLFPGTAFNALTPQGDDQLFSTAALRVLAPTATGPSPSDFGQGVFIDLLTFQFDYVADAGDAFTFRYDPAETPDGQHSAVVVTQWLILPFGGEVLPGFSLFGSTTNHGDTDASAITIFADSNRALPAPGTLVVALLAGIRRRRA